MSLAKLGSFYIVTVSYLIAVKSSSMILNGSDMDLNNTLYGIEFGTDVRIDELPRSVHGLM